jgi:hypothetical protein
MTYKFKYRRKWLSKSIAVIGHGYNKDLDRMTLYLESGAVKEIPNWRECECSLGIDWVLAVKKDMEKKAGQAIPIDRNTSAK